MRSMRGGCHRRVVQEQRDAREFKIVQPLRPLVCRSPRAMDDLERLITSKDYAKLVEVCQDMELAYHTGDSAAIPLSHVYSLLLAAYIILDNM